MSSILKNVIYFFKPKSYISDMFIYIERDRHDRYGNDTSR